MTPFAAGPVRAATSAVVGTVAPSDPTRLPGDIALPRTPPAGPPPAAVLTPGPSLALALQAAQAALQRCAAAGENVSVSVVDTLGHPRVTLAADGIPGRLAYIATRKALVALAFGKPSSYVALQLDKNPDMAAKVTPGMVVAAGAIPLMRNRQVIGAIGVSGAPSETDELCARAGATAISVKL